VTPEALASEVREWLDANWDPDLPLLDWRRRLVDSGWAVPSWSPEWYGRGLPGWADEVVSAQIREVGAVGPPIGVGTWLAAPTLLAFASDELKKELLLPLLTGEHTWCQLFSEPGAGSDLAGLTCSAVRDGADWVVNGQKVWNTNAQHADLGMLVARTDWSLPKHQGLTYFVLPMRQDGVEVRPILEMNWHDSFNEVFITNARIPERYVVGEVGEGWKVAMTTLAHERGFSTIRPQRFPGGATGRAQKEAQAEFERFYKPYEWYPQRAGRPDLVADLARQSGRADDPLVRQEVAGLYALSKAHAWTAERARVSRALGRPPGPEGSLGKLGLSVVARRAAAVHSMIAGASATLWRPDAPLGGVVSEILLSVPAQPIAGGTDEIQRNIIGEKVLGLPREPGPARDTPFSELPRNG
jgi:alkylation response protein AidB-like acyl-CoA dehydrogenase